MNLTAFILAFVPLLVLVALYLAWTDRVAIAQRLHAWLIENVATQRDPDLVIGDPADPYLLRWWLIRCRFGNLYLHQFLRSDDDRALHDHPWHSISLLLAGEAIEHTIAAGGVHHRRWLCIGNVRLRSATMAHRIELPPPAVVGDVEPRDCWTLIATGPDVREWGFHCAKAGWIHNRRFALVAGRNSVVSQGCGE